MEYKFIKEEVFYDGSQLRSHFAYEHSGVKGDSIVAFIGGAEVEGARLVDLEDRREGRKIYSSKMLHTIIEHYQDSLDLVIALQLFFMGIACNELNMQLHRPDVQRRGDDLYFHDRKLSVSIATCSPVSTVIHAGFNIETDGTPVPTAGLSEMNIDPEQFAMNVMDRYVKDIHQMKHARWKIRSVP